MDHLRAIKSVIVTAAAEFRTVVISSLNAVGFPADKKVVGQVAALLEEADVQANGNFVIDLQSLTIADLPDFLSSLQKTTFASTAFFLFYLPAASAAKVEELAQAYPRFSFRVMPFKRQDIIDTFVKPRPAPMVVKAPAKTPAKAAPPTGHKSPPADAKAANPIIADASEHVRVATDKLKSLIGAPPPAAVARQLVADIGQRFNGVYGTLLFFRNRDGFAQLGRLCEIIDAIGKTEGRRPDAGDIPKAHLELLLAAARCVFGMLKELRANKPLSEAVQAECTRLDGLYQAMPEMFHRSGASDADIDALIDGQKKGA